MPRHISYSLCLILTIVVIAFFVAHGRNVSAENRIPDSVIISEIAWGGTAASASDEWIELYNGSCEVVDVAGWTLSSDDGTPSIMLAGSIGPRAFYLLERGDDNTVSDIAADQIYAGTLANGGESLTLRDAASAVIDTANQGGSSWYAGSGSPNYVSMERMLPFSSDDATGWLSNDLSLQVGQDANGNLLSATAKHKNTRWSDFGCDSAEISVALGPIAPQPDGNYRVSAFINSFGGLPAEDVVVSADVSAGLTILSGNNPTLIGSLGTPDLAVIDYQLGVDDMLNAQLAMTVTVSMSTVETDLTDNVNTATLTVGNPILINAANVDAYTDGDEAVQLINISATPVDVGGWRLSDNRFGGVTLPAETQLAPESTLWLAKERDSFVRHFGFEPAFDAASLGGSWPLLNDGGDTIFLFNAIDVLQDGLIYENGDTTAGGWNGDALYAFRPNTGFAKDGQILYRKVDPQTGLPVPDTDTAADWAQDPNDPLFGQKVRYPGWSLDQFATTQRFTETAELTIGITPDNGFELVKGLIDSAETSIKVSTFTFTNHDLMLAFVAAAQRGVEIDILQEGAPPGGLLDQQRYICQQIEAASDNARCWFMINENDSSLPIQQRTWDRYKFLHAKYIIVDDSRAMISTDNLSINSMTTDTSSGTTSGRRGVQIVTNAGSVVSHLQSIWADDFAPATDYDTDCRGTIVSPEYHCDIFRWTASDPIFGTRYGVAPPSFVPDVVNGGITYTIRYPQPTTVVGTFPFELIQSPENSLRPDGGIFALLANAGVGDTVYVQQLDERAHWGDGNDSAENAPNLRIEAYIDAARRGASVWVLLDSFFAGDYYDPDDPPTNSLTCGYLSSIARAEQLDLRCAVGNPTDKGIHNKMVIAEIDGKGYINIGSINGSEQSNKANREVAIQVQSDEAYALLADMFTRDYPHRIFIPLVMNQSVGPANYPVISEILYNSPGPLDEAEFIEIANPTSQPLDLSGWMIGDAVSGEDFEDNKIFPAGTILQPGEAVVVAFKAVAFSAEFGANPDFELLDSDPTVPDMIDDPLYDPAALLRLGNSGDEVLLRNADRQLVDVVTYGSGSFPGVVPIPLASSTNSSLERYPFYRDSDNGVNDFRENVPSPGRLPR